MYDALLAGAAGDTTITEDIPGGGLLPLHVMDVEVGTPSQTFTLSIDTGSSYMVRKKRVHSLPPMFFDA